MQVSETVFLGTSCMALLRAEMRSDLRSLKEKVHFRTTRTQPKNYARVLSGPLYNECV